MTENNKYKQIIKFNPITAIEYSSCYKPFFIMIYRDHFQNYKSYAIPKAQLIIADIPYNLGNNAYASNPAWYKDGDNANGESALAGKSFFDTDEDFRPAEFMHFCSQQC
jgi:site-specific DNA-methyltransferase (adenine-specific)